MAADDATWAEESFRCCGPAECESGRATRGGAGSRASRSNSRIGTTLDTLSYCYTDASNVYDPTGHMRREVDGANRTHACFYDCLCQLVQETHPDLGSISYSFDLNGNRRSKTTSARVDYYGVDANNKLQWVNRGTNAAPTSGQTSPYTLFGYDAAGRTTYRERLDSNGVLRKYSLAWDGDDRLRSITQGSTSYLSASYNGAGLRIAKTDLWTGSHNYSWGPGGVLTDDSASGGIYTPGLARRQGSTDLFIDSDNVGSTRALANSTGTLFPNGFRYDAYGNRTATGGTPYDPIDFQFGGQLGYQTEYADATTNEPGVGLLYLQQRYYDPAVGRFISPDPLGLAAGLNRYEYAGDDPVNAVDPTGNDPQGLELASWWLYGMGRTFAPSGAAAREWGQYMMASPKLKTFVADELTQVATDLADWPTGYSEPFFIETNGGHDHPLAINTNDEGCGLFERMDGYTLLDGPNIYYGGLQLYGVATKEGDKDVRLIGTAVWNDRMESKYWQDTVKMWIARLAFPGAVFTARDYTARIAWQFQVDHTWGDSWAKGNKSWPFNAGN